MLKKELIDLLYGGNSVAFIGSGVSVDAGLPTWPSLYSNVVDIWNETHPKQQIHKDIPGDSALLPIKFQQLEKVMGEKKSVLDKVHNVINRIDKPGHLHNLLSNWPFRFYVTVNYDFLLEKALQEDKGWVAIGNSRDECRKLSGGVSHVVWHLHGGFEFDESSKCERIVLSQRDYEEVYPFSPIVETIKVIARAYQIVFVGFGFRDPGLIQILEAVSKDQNFERPSYVFLGQNPTDLRSEQGQKQRNEFRIKYNAEIIPYLIEDGLHIDLKEVMSSYAPFILSRSATLGQMPSGTPGYDPCVASLEIANRLFSDSSVNLGEGAEYLCRARILAELSICSPQSDRALCRPNGQISLDESMYKRSLAALTSSGFICQKDEEVSLTESGRAIVVSAKAYTELLWQQLRKSILDRASKLAPSSAEVNCAIAAGIASDFFEELCKKRGLGVGQVLISRIAGQKAQRIAALLETLPEYLKQAHTRVDAQLAIRIVVSVLELPTEQEKTYLGLLTQAYFGQNLIGAIDNVRKLDQEFLGKSCFFLDSNVIILALAQGADGYLSTNEFIKELKSLGSKLITTDLLINEVSDHANWALKFAQRAKQDEGEFLDVARGARGYRPNLFIQGFVRSKLTEAGDTFDEYMHKIFGKTKRSKATDLEIRNTVCRIADEANFNQWDDFNQEWFVQRDYIQAEIQRRREMRGTYKGPDQTKAEAEIALLVTKIRQNITGYSGMKFKGSFFISYTRVIDNIQKLEQRIVLPPEGLIQWLWSSSRIDTTRAQAIFEMTLHALSQHGVEFMPEELLLRRFSGVVEASERRFEKLVQERRADLIDKFGADPLKAFESCSDIDKPLIERLAAQYLLDKMETRLKESQKLKEEAEKKAKISEKERQELSRFRARQAVKKQKHEKKKRSVVSDPKKKRNRSR